MLNRSVVKSYSKHWKQKNSLKNIVGRLKDLVSGKEYVDLKIKTRKKLDALIETKTNKQTKKRKSLIATKWKAVIASEDSYLKRAVGSNISQ